MSFLVPHAGAVVRLAGDRVDVEAPGLAVSFQGALAADIAALATGTVSPRLAALATCHEAAREVLSWKEHAWVPLTALDAVRLDGFDTLFLELTGTCNERCLHCYAESSPQVRAALDRETCERVIDDALEVGFQRIQFTGGDPLLCRFLPELLARASGFPVREIYTNGLLLDDRLLDKLAPHGPSFAFSYYSCDPAIHDAITRTPGSHRKTRAAIGRVIERGLAARVSIVVMNENVDTIDATVEDLERAGVTHVATSAGRSAGRGSAFAWQPKPTERTGTSAGHRSAGGASDGKLAITYEGQVVPCIFNRNRVLGTLGPDRRLRDVLASLSVTPGPAADIDKLSCVTCRITDRALAVLGGS